MKFLPDVLARKAGRQILIAQKHAPEILFGVGVTGVIGSTVLACRATLKLETTLEIAQNDLFVLRNTAELDDTYPEENLRRDLTIVYVRSALRVAKLYGPAVVLGGASIAALTSSHNMLTSRNAALAAAYTAVQRGFDEYRARVVEKYGEEEDRNLRYAAERVQVIDPETRRKKAIMQATADGASMYARFFDQNSRNWDGDHPEYNVLFIKTQQVYLNHVLLSRGHVFLNEAYDALDIPRTKAGQAVGWFVSRDRPNGDGYIDFGTFDNTDGPILLDFNVDGPIYDLIGN